MCGICGIISDQFTADNQFIVKEMNDRLYHRGPDMEGCFSDHDCSLAMRRLSIIDLGNGRQPMRSNSGKAIIVFNGEIYNYRELRNELCENGYRFYTDSDTEVIVNAYEFWGEAAVQRLRGMFAFCIYHVQEKKWFFARDRFGEKPLFFFHRRGYLSFSSEIGSLLCDPGVPRRVNAKRIPYYLTLSYVPEPDTLLEGVMVLPAGHLMVFSDSGLSMRKYFDPRPNVDHSVRSLSEACEMVRPAWERSVKRQMIADVPLGAFLSGGIDSSSVVATMQAFSAAPVKTFTVKFAESTYDESSIAREVARKLGTDHHEIFIPNGGFTQDIFWELIDKIGVPFPDSSSIPSYYITKEIRRHVKVALSGDGGDEVFGGYTLFNWYRRIFSLSRIPDTIREASVSLLKALKLVPATKKWSALRQAKNALELSHFSASELPFKMHTLIGEDDIERLFSGYRVDFSDMEWFPDDYAMWSSLRQIMYFRMKFNLPLDMLTKVDRMSMANSLEVRAPFLDADLFEVASKLPDQFLMPGKTGKVVIRELMKNKLPNSVFDHPKTGFSIPLHKYQNDEFVELVQELLLSGNHLGAVAKKEVLKRIVKNGLSTSSDNSTVSVYKASHQLWSLMQLSGWMKYYRVSW